MLPAYRCLWGPRAHYLELELQTVVRHARWMLGTLEGQEVLRAEPTLQPEHTTVYLCVLYFWQKQGLEETSASSDSSIFGATIAETHPWLTMAAAPLCPYLPLPMDGKAMDFSFLSSARAKQFFTVFSRSSSHLSAPQTGLLQWITNLAGRPWPALTAARRNKRKHTSRHERPRPHLLFCSRVTPSHLLATTEAGVHGKHGEHLRLGLTHQLH